MRSSISLTVGVTKSGEDDDDTIDDPGEGGLFMTGFSVVLTGNGT